MDLLPASASPLQLHRQAKRILRSTSRAKEPDWYRRAHELNLQWHLWIGAHTGVSAIYNRQLKLWWEGPDLPPLSFEPGEEGEGPRLSEGSQQALHETLQSLFANKEFGGGKVSRSLGIVIHLAEGMRVRNLAPDFAADADFDTLNELLITAPEVAIGDDTLDSQEGMWRLVPLVGVNEGERRSFAVQIPSKLKLLAQELRRYGERSNQPVLVETRCAPLEALSALSHVHPALLAPDQGPSIALLQYETMTLLFAQGSRSELLLVRPLFHRGAPHLSPAEVHEVISQTAALLNIKDPAIILASLVGLSEAELQALLESYQEQYPQARTYCLDVRRHEFVAKVPEGCLEMAAAVCEAPPGLDESPQRKAFREKWTWQDFYGPSQEEAARMPSCGDLRLLKFGGLALKVAAVGLLAYAGWIGMDFLSKMRSEVWALPKDAAETKEAEFMKLQKEKREWEHWNNLLAKRSEGWLALQALLEIFPENGGVILKDASYRTDITSNSKDTTAGITRQWTLSGFANPELASNLSTLGSRARVSELLNGIAERNYAPYLSVDADTRDLQVTLQQKQGTMPPSNHFPAKVARHFRIAFDLSILQSLNGKDDLALNLKPLKPE